MRLQKGQSLFEVVVSLAIAALIVLAIVSLTSNSIRNAVYSRNNSQAALRAQEAIEWLRGQRDSNIDEFFDNVLIPTYCLDNLDWTNQGACGTTEVINGTPFFRQVDFTLSTISGKTLLTAVVVVSWTDAQGVHDVTSSTTFTDWRQR